MVASVATGAAGVVTVRRAVECLALLENLTVLPLAQMAGESSADGGLIWWAWPLLLFGFCFALGIVAILAGVGGGVLYVPLVSWLFPFHLDFVRGAGLFMALAGALTAGPRLLRSDLATLRLTLPFALMASTFSIFGALLGLGLPTQYVQLCLGILILGVTALTIASKNTERPIVTKQDALGHALGLSGFYTDAASGERIEWKTHRTWIGMLLFAFIGVIAGMFGLGAGWANVPALNLVLGLPLKLSVGSSVFILSVTDTSAAWIYFHRGAVLPMIAVPSVVGLMLGSLVGVRLLAIVKPKYIRYLVIAMLGLAGLRALLKGFGI
jgi:uncharacterized membrane protein YfcA